MPIIIAICGSVKQNMRLTYRFPSLSTFRFLHTYSSLNRNNFTVSSSLSCFSRQFRFLSRAYMRKLFLYPTKLENHPCIKETPERGIIDGTYPSGRCPQAGAGTAAGTVPPASDTGTLGIRICARVPKPGVERYSRPYASPYCRRIR